jgi:hypothetical protein
MAHISRQRLLALLAKSTVGRTHAFLRARGLKRETLATLVRGGLATLVPGGTASTAGAKRKHRFEVVRVKITEAGRAALSELYDPSSFVARRNLATEIMRLCPPPPGCRPRARLILERKFMLNELRVLVRALREGIADEQHSTARTSSASSLLRASAQAARLRH